jgi:mono/diheme cytochrome c family protein
MKFQMVVAVVAAALGSISTEASAYPGGTPNYQTDVAPFCASCHSSRGPEALAGVGERADKEVAERKHIAVVLAGEKGYAQLSEVDRQTLAEQIRALDVASSVAMTAPEGVEPGATFDVTIRVTGGAGPVIGVALVDRDHRWYAKPAPSVGFTVVAPPDIEGPDGKPQFEWLASRPEEFGRNLAYVNVTGVASDSAAKEWSSARVTFHLRAPDRPGRYPLSAAYFYGTEKSSVLGYTTNAVGWKEVRGGVGGGSGRLMFTPVQQIVVGVE